ncbi:hypothetical protein DICPUDRAFT_98341 [Dictyostelium purpureum]|uniref:Uncharacterized protein n=1 Tax=Dictyostelium purpureum TaxID=5786 RepID=F0ZPP4_DICPU|nr:uncharacterized protein DICPUDRAFT_98341 [Dictyostelium purpureum]EGC34088.1 hypothetical protein DICPUDRAFT_98341 [Dictyostelium purpureum]|eukprot:XP_003289381.1 hypothetical protein DICPUDRAFT_98341 [Dictyostelium purpureum]
MENYIKNTLELLDIEKESEVNESIENFSTLSNKQLELKGVTIKKVRIDSISSGLGGRSLLKFVPPEYTNSSTNNANKDNSGANNTNNDDRLPNELPPHKFTPGDIVGIRGSKSKPGTNHLVTGVVYKVDSLKLVVAVDDLDSSDKEGQLSASALLDDQYDSMLFAIDKLANDVTYKKIKEALEKLKSSYHGESGQYKYKQRYPDQCSMINPTRIGHPTRILPQLLKHTLDHKTKNGENAQVIRDLRQEISDLTKKIKTFKLPSERKSTQSQIKQLRIDLRHREKSLVEQVIKSSNIILSTNTGASDSSIRGNDDFDWVEFYESKMIADSSVANHLLVSNGDKIRSTLTTTSPLLLIDTSGCDMEESQDDEGESKFNQGEVSVVKRHIEKLVECNVSPNNIGVITPYNGQVKLLKSHLSKSALEYTEPEFLASDDDIWDENLKGDQDDNNITSENKDESKKQHDLGKKSKAELYREKKNKKQQDDKEKQHMKDQNINIKEKEKLIAHLDSIVNTFINSSLPSHSFPSTLSSLERLVVHELAEKYKLNHESIGEGENRIITISKKPKQLQQQQQQTDSKDDSDNEQDNEEDYQEEGDEEEDGTTKTTTAGPVNKSKKKKKKSKKPATTNNQPSKPTESSKKKPVEKKSADQLLKEFEAIQIKEVNLSICGFKNCGKNVEVLGRVCQFCSHKFCTQHFLYEIHGCGDRAKAKAREDWFKQHADAKKNVVAHEKLQKSINDQASSRKKKTPSKK